MCHFCTCIDTDYIMTCNICTPGPIFSHLHSMWSTLLLSHDCVIHYNSLLILHNLLVRLSPRSGLDASSFFFFATTSLSALSKPHKVEFIQLKIFKNFKSYIEHHSLSLKVGRIKNSHMTDCLDIVLLWDCLYGLSPMCF